MIRHENRGNRIVFFSRENKSKINFFRWIRGESFALLLFIGGNGDVAERETIFHLLSSTTRAPRHREAKAETGGARCAPKIEWSKSKRGRERRREK